jgi:hypothetical protein
MGGVSIKDAADQIYADLAAECSRAGSALNAAQAEADAVHRALLGMAEGDYNTAMRAAQSRYARRIAALMDEEP